MIWKILNGIFFTVIVFIALFLLATQFPLFGNIQVRIVESGSMEPTIRTGSVVVIKPAEDYGVGDIITFEGDTPTVTPTTHRIIEIDSDGSFVTQGDANDSRDIAPVGSQKILGEVVFTIPYVGYVVDFARTPLGFIILIVVPAFIVIVDEIVIIFKEASRLRKKKRDINTPE